MVFILITFFSETCYGYGIGYLCSSGGKCVQERYLCGDGRKDCDKINEPSFCLGKH